jgi:hypothetical protein
MRLRKLQTRVSRKRYTLAATALMIGSGFALSTRQAFAVEGGVYGAPLGGTDIRQAYLPPVPGLYGGVAGVTSNSPDYRDQNGNVGSANPAFLHAQILGLGFLYEYNWKPAGFSLASSFQFNYIFEHQALTVGNTFLHGNARGLQDSFSDLLFASKYLGLYGATPGDNPKLKYGLTAAIALSAEIPIGNYNVSNFVNPGKNTFITIPNIALTYLTKPAFVHFGDGTEISTRFFFDTNRRNSISGYQGGNLIDLDYAITERVGHFQGGVAGDYAQQLNGDHNTSYGLVAPGGDIYAKVDIGPVLAYDDPVTQGTFKVKALFPVYHQNNYDATTVVISFARKLF